MYRAAGEDGSVVAGVCETYSHAAECKVCGLYGTTCRGIVVWTEEGCRTAKEWGC